MFKDTIKTTGHQWCRSGVFSVKFEHTLHLVLVTAASKWYSSAGHHEQKNIKTGQIKVLAVTIKQRLNKTSLTTFSM